MTECNYFEVPCSRNLPSNFSAGVQDFVFSVGAPNAWIPCKSYFRVDMSIYNAGSSLPLIPSQMSALADNACGNLYDNVYARAGQQDISNIVIYSQQASALDVRLNNTLPWLKSMGSSTAVNESSFMKRLAQVAANPAYVANSGPQLTRINNYETREIYRPVDTGSYATSGIYVTPATTAGTVLTAAATVTGDAHALFTTGMPQILAATPGGQNVNTAVSDTGGSILPGDILVLNGIEMEVLTVTAANSMTVNYAGLGIGDNTHYQNDWFIVRGDVIRSKQACSSTYGIWQPPIGLFKYNEELGAGDYRIQLNPNVNYQLAAVECRNPTIVSGAALPYRLVINDVRFYCYMEKRSIPDTVRDLYLTEMNVQSKPWSNNLQFSVPPSTMALTFFLQENSSGSNPYVPPSMFRCLNNSDLNLTNIQVTYANVTKPSVNWQSNYAVATTSGANVFNGSGTNKLEQRYHDSYEESGLDCRLAGMETFYDYLQRGPFYHFSFERDVNNKSTEVQITSVFSGAVPSSPNQNLFCVAHFRKTVQITTSNGLIVNVSSRQV